MEVSSILAGMDSNMDIDMDIDIDLEPEYMESVQQVNNLSFSYSLHGLSNVTIRITSSFHLCKIFPRTSRRTNNH